ncbi:MAG: alpha/beta hydrolase [Gammaproteobacteria bacterium]|nr:alpha/beta hydrolase [Gammaproteobacteria bacterium]
MPGASIDPELETQYNNRAAVADHADYFEHWRKTSIAFRQSRRAETDIPYGDHARNRLDIFRPQGEARGLFLFIHGGYWQAMDKSSFSWLAGPVNRRDETLITINYGLCPAVSMATLVEHVRLALLWVYRNRQTLAGPSAKLTLCGHSAGGHLVAELLSTDWQGSAPFIADGFIHKAIPISGLFDLRPMVKTSINQALSLDARSADLFSPLLRQPTIACDLELWLGALESQEYHRQSSSLLTAWRDSMPDSRMTSLPGKHHFSVLEAVLDRYGQAD